MKKSDRRVRVQYRTKLEKKKKMLKLARAKDLTLSQWLRDVVDRALNNITE